MFGALPDVGQWQRALIRASQLTIVAGIVVALTALFAPQKFDTGVWLLVQQNPQRWIAGATLWLVLLLYGWTRQALMVSRVVNDIYGHVRQYANDYDVLMRSVLRRNQFTPPEHINTLDELTRFIKAMMQQAIRDQQQLTECTVALGEERLQRSIVERQTSYVRGGVSRVLHDGKDIHNDIIYLLDDIARESDTSRREDIRRQVALLQSRLLRIVNLQLSFQPGEVVRKGLAGDATFNLRQAVVDAYLGRLWRFYDGAGYETLTRSIQLADAEEVWQWRVQELCARAENVGALKGNPHDLWLCIDNMVFNAIDAMARADQRQQQPLADVDAQSAIRLPSLLLTIEHVNNDGVVQIALRNRGPWISPDLLQGDLIWQLRDTHAHEGASHRGRGIGLYCIKQIIDVGYGGHVQIANVRNDTSIIPLQLQLEDGSRIDLCLHLAGADSDGSPLLALGDASGRNTALLPGATLNTAVSVIAISQKAIVADGITTASGDVVFIDRFDVSMPRWYAIRKQDAMHFYPVDQRGVMVSLRIPVNKFVR